MTNQSSIKILNGLLENLIDSVDGYNTAAEVAERTTFKRFFKSRAEARGAMAAVLRSEIAELGGTPEKDGTILARAHRVFIKISVAVQDNDEAAIEAVEDGESYLREKFKDAIGNENLSEKAKQAIGAFQGELLADGRMIDHLENSV